MEGTSLYPQIYNDLLLALNIRATVLLLGPPREWILQHDGSFLFVNLQLN